MKRPLLKKIVITITLVVVFTFLLTFWLITTESGLHAIYHFASTNLPGKVTVEKLEGSLIGPITAKGIGYQQDGTVIKAEKVVFEWSPSALLAANIDITRVYVQSLSITLPATEKKDPDVTLPDLYMPWRVTLKNLMIDGFNIHQPKQIFSLKTIKLNANTRFSLLDIESLNLVADNYSLNLKGELQTASDYQHKLDIDWLANLPSKSALKGSGRIEGNVATSNVHHEVKGPIQLTLNAEVHDLLRQLNWQVDATFTDINFGELMPNWPGQLKGTISSKGRLDNGQLLADTNIVQLTGKLRGYPVALHSQLAWRNDGLDISRFDLHSGSARVSAQGRVSTKLDLAWDINSTNLAELYPQAKGQFQGKGRFSGALIAPQIDVSLNGKALRLSDYEIGTLNGEFSIDLFRWQHIKVKLASQALKLNDFEIQSVLLDADTHNLNLDVISGVATAQIKVSGKTGDQGWRGHIDKIDIQSQRFDNWMLNSPAALNINKKTFSLESLCLNSRDAKLCTTLRREQVTWESRIEMSKLPLLLLSPWLPPDIKIEGVANATAELNYLAPDLLLGQANIDLPTGVLSYPLLEGGRNQWVYRSGKVDIKINQQGLEASSEISISKDSQFKAQLSLPGAKLLALDNTQILQASAKLNVNDLGLIEALVPDIQDLKGEVGLSFAATGTLAQPRLSGHADLLNGTLQIPRLGLTIKELAFKSRTDGFEKLDFQLRARSGDGNLAIQGHTMLNKSAGWPSSINIKGEMFEVSRIPVARVVISPNLQVTIRNRNININGDIHIPYTKLQPKDITAAARVSQDVVVTSSEQPLEEKWSIFTKVRLTLGERVNFFGFGFEGRFDGNLLLEDEPGKPTKATGEINIPEGRYMAYGLRLAVEHGRVLYTGGPLSNPGLDLRAVRKIGNVTAGLKVKGSLSQPQVEIFSIPAMGETDALAYLILGRPIENASNDDGALMAKAALAIGLSGGDSIVRRLGDRFGLDEMRIESSETGEQASLVIGRYLSPKLYVGYGVGLIESFNTFYVRYQISNKWQLQGESGEHHGADLLFTIER